MNSAQSQKLAVGSIVHKYTTADMANTNQPVMRSYVLKLFILIFSSKNGCKIMPVNADADSRQSAKLKNYLGL